MPTFRQFEYLVAVADLKHFGRAAASLRVSQPTLSLQLQQLERRLGAILIDRNRNAVELTPIGRQVVERARSILLEVNELKALAARSAERMAGTFRFGVTPTLGPYLMPGVIADLHKAYPDMRLYIREGIPDEQVEELRRGKLDMMLSPLPVNGDDLEIEPLFREPLHLVAPHGHPLTNKPVLTRKHFAGMALLSLDPRHHFHRQTRVICDDLGAILLRDYEGTSLDSLRQMVGSGLGLGVLPRLYIHSEAGGQDMINRLDVADWSASRSIAAIWRRGSASRDLFSVIAEKVAQEAHRLLQEPEP